MRLWYVSDSLSAGCVNYLHRRVFLLLDVRRGKDTVSGFGVIELAPAFEKKSGKKSGTLPVEYHRLNGKKLIGGPFFRQENYGNAPGLN